MQTTTTITAAFLLSNLTTATVDAIGAHTLVVRREASAEAIVLDFTPGANLNTILVHVSGRDGYLETVTGRHTIGGEPVDADCLGHSCLNAINAHSYRGA